MRVIALLLCLELKDPKHLNKLGQLPSYERERFQILDLLSLAQSILVHSGEPAL